MKQREVAEADGDTEALRKLDLELEDIEAQADKIDRRRTLGFKSITSINQRNRVLSVLQAEEAIRKESEEARNSKEEDPFTRVHSQPVIVTKKYLEKLRHKRVRFGLPFYIRIFLISFILHQFIFASFEILFVSLGLLVYLSDPGSIYWREFVCADSEALVFVHKSGWILSFSGSYFSTKHLSRTFIAQARFFTIVLVFTGFTDC